MEQLKSIQALRAVAAIAVMFAHLHGVEARQSGGEPILSSAWITGVSGVDLFFVISGFIMVWVAGDKAASFRNSGKFLFARVMRIYPLWWLFAAAMAGYLWITYGVPWDAEMLQRLDTGGAEHLIKSFLLVPHEAFPILPLGWTLMHEMYFYLVFAGLILLPVSYRIPALIFWAMLILASISAQLTGFYADTIASLILFPMTLEFLMGAGVAWAIKAGATRYGWFALLAGIWWLSAAAWTVNFTDTTVLLPIQRTFAFGPAFALLVYAVVALERTTSLAQRIPAPLIWLGDWSYSLYLCHLLVISAVGRLFFPVFGSAGPIDNVIFIGLSIAASLAVAGLTYRLFEAPILSRSRTWRERLFKASD